MELTKERSVLISGASMAGLSAAYWMNRLGYKVMVVELANEPRTAGAAVDIIGPALDAIKRMGIFEQLQPYKLHVDRIEFKNAGDVTEGSMSRNDDATELPGDDIEIERDKFVAALYGLIKKDVAFMFNDSITSLIETEDGIVVNFKNSPERAFDLVLGCDGIHSVVRKLSFGEEAEFAHFLEAYFFHYHRK